MDPDRHREIKAIAEAALELPTARRGGYVREACRDESTRAAVFEWLAAVGESERLDFLGAGPLDEAPREIGSGEKRYRIERELGRGGMGTVYLAERADAAFRQRVAIKVVGLEAGADEAALKRFALERQILADLEHPGIARLIDGGTLGDGRPYLVMEYVDGERIDRWCERRALGVRERLALFAKVCAAVSYAHGRLVVHRDLKPGNILVDERGEPRLLDFGIAKLLGGDGAATATNERVLTFGYASPEQVRGRAVGTASDVYSLGVLLYRLLTGRLPYRVPEDSVPALARAILEDDPTPASQRARDPDGPDGTPPTLRIRLDRDLDEILLKALRKEPERRYASVEALAQDLERYRDGLPVLARRGSRSYRAAKFARRHRYAVGAGIGVLALVLGFAADRQRQLAATELERDRAERLVGFMTGLFEGADPEKAGGAKVTVAQVIDAAAHRAQIDDSQQPLDRAAMLHTIGSVYRSLGAFDRAQPLLEQAHELRAAAPGATLEAARTEIALAAVAAQRRKVDDAEPLLRAARARLVARGGESDWRVAEVDGRIALLERERDHPERAQQGLEAALARMLGALGYAAPPAAADPARPREGLLALADLLQNAGVVAQDRKDWALAEPRLKQAIALRRAVAGPADPVVTTALSALANLYRERGELVASRSLREEILAQRERAYGPEHWQVGVALVNLGDSHAALAEWDVALAMAQRATAIFERTLGESHPYTLIALGNQSTALSGAGDYARALPLAQTVLARRRAVLPADHPDIALALFQVGTTLMKSGRPAEAMRAYDESFAIYAKRYGADHPLLDESRVSEADVLVALGRVDEAQARLRRVVAHEGRPDASEPIVAAAKFRLAKLLGGGPEANALARAAAAIAHRDGRTDALDPAEIDAWIAAHP